MSDKGSLPGDLPRDSDVAVRALNRLICCGSDDPLGDAELIRNNWPTTEYDSLGSFIADSWTGALEEGQKVMFDPSPPEDWLDVLEEEDVQLPPRSQLGDVDLSDVVKSSVRGIYQKVPDPPKKFGSRIGKWLTGEAVEEAFLYTTDEMEWVSPKGAEEKFEGLVHKNCIRHCKVLLENLKSMQKGDPEATKEKLNKLFFAADLRPEDIGISKLDLQRPRGCSPRSWRRRPPPMSLGEYLEPIVRSAHARCAAEPSPPPPSL